MKFEVTDGGFISRRDAHTPTAIAVMPRCAHAPNRDLICSYVVQSTLGANDFVPMLSRSKDDGRTWEEQGPIWPGLMARYSIVCSVSQAEEELFLFGSRTPIDRSGETFWSDATQGLKQNELIWAKSANGGRTWTDPAVIGMPIQGAAEVPGPLCITHDGQWVGPFAPYNTFEPELMVDRHQVVVVISADQGKSWSHTSMLRFDDPESGGAEAWVVELADGRLLGTSWHMNYRDGSDYPNAYALSHDGGLTWQPTRSTGILGQSTALAPLPDGRALFIYNQRKHGELGIWLAVVNPTNTAFGVEANQAIWLAETDTQEGSPGQHSQWKEFAFGEPSVVLLQDSTLLATFWCIQSFGGSIRYLRLRMTA